MNYIEEANRTMSSVFHGELVSAHELNSAIEEAVTDLSILDVLKKSLFYGRVNPNTMDWVMKDINLSTVHQDRELAVHILHGIIGAATEAGEMLEALLKALTGERLDMVNLLEECGDNQWYIAAILRAAGTTFEDVHFTNIAKLRARFPDKFTEHAANNRDLNAERALLETPPTTPSSAKPVVKIKDYAFVGNILVGTAINHPKGRGGPCEVRTSTILSRDIHNGTVETRNTIYKLVGEPG